MPVEIWPDANYQPLPEATTQSKITPRVCIWHTNAAPHYTPWKSLWNYLFRKDVVGESHFQNDWGEMIQFMPLNVRADCNAKANAFAISVESADYGYLTLQTTPWNEGQVERAAHLAAYLKVHYGIPLEIAKTWDGHGHGPHNLFPEWSIYKGKTCPGAARTAQIQRILNRANELLNPPPIVFDPLHGQWSLYPLNANKPVLWQEMPITPETKGFVLYLQGVLRLKLGQPQLALDGVYGPQTAEAVKKMQDLITYLGTPIPDITRGAVGPVEWKMVDTAAGWK